MLECAIVLCFANNVFDKVFNIYKYKQQGRKMKKISILTGITVMGAVLLSGCMTKEDYAAERAKLAALHFEKANFRTLEKTQMLSLKDCMTMALEHNLDLKVNRLEENVAKEMRTAEALGMLPELTVSNNFTARENEPASRSKSVSEGGATYNYSTSTDKNINYLNFDLALSFLDFGLAFFNTQQGNDRMLIRQMRTKRAAQNLSYDVARVYYQVAAAQKAIGITKQLLEDCKDRYKLIEQLREERKIDPFRAFDETTRFINMEKRLTNYIRSYENSCVELRALLGLYPNTDILVDDSVLDNGLVPFELPELTLMEQIALLERPELYEIDMQRHINVIELRKTILLMFPNVRMYLDFTNSNNSFLYNASWFELGIRAAYNLLKLPQQIATAVAYSDQIDAEEARSYAQAIGVMAQVRIAHANMSNMKQRFEIDERVFKAYSANLKAAQTNIKTSGGLSQLELDHIRLSTAEVQIEKLMSLGNYYVSYYRILNTLGVDGLDQGTLDVIKTELESGKERAAKEIAKAKAEYDESVNVVVAEGEAAVAEVIATPVEEPAPNVK